MTTLERVLTSTCRNNCKYGLEAISRCYETPNNRKPFYKYCDRPCAMKKHIEETAKRRREYRKCTNAINAEK